MNKSDIIGGSVLAVGSLFYLLNIAEALGEGTVAGVSFIWAVYFSLLNFVYCWVFWNNRLPFSFTGSLCLALTETVYASQIFYYNFIGGAA